MACSDTAPNPPSITWQISASESGQLLSTDLDGFLDLLDKGLAYRDDAPTIWCPECQTAFAQAELDDLERDTIFHTISFRTDGGQIFPIATTRPELLPACVAVFVHPDDIRFSHLIGKDACVPYFGQLVPIIADEGADPNKGTGAVMCCTFGDTADVDWWRKYDLSLVEAIDKNGAMTPAAGLLSDLSTKQARLKVSEILKDMGLLHHCHVTPSFWSNPLVRCRNLRLGFSAVRENKTQQKSGWRIIAPAINLRYIG